jgi:short subunit dehydrogenase-like uncharacterized protein
VSAELGHRVLVYGASGFTGRLVVDEARRHGLELVLAGRNRAALERLREAIGMGEIRVADASRPETLSRIMDGIPLVINCAGPFTHFGEPVLRAALEAGAHYVDTTAEQHYMARVIDALGADAERRGLTAIVAQAFEYAVGDCAARIATEETPGTETLEVFHRVENFRATPGTLKSALEALRAPTLALVNGRRRRELPAAYQARAQFPDEDETRLGVSYGGGEVLSAPSFAPSMRTVRTYLVVPTWSAAAARPLLRVAAPLLRGRLRRWVERRIDAKLAGPGDERRDQPWWVLARARAPGGRGTCVTASGYDSYGITAVIAVLGARWLLEGRAKRCGVLTSAQALDPRAFLDALTDSGVSWRIDPF